MKKELNERITKAFAAVTEAVVANPKLANEAVDLITGLTKEFRAVARDSYKAGVAARKAEREEKRAAKSEAVAKAKKAKDDAKAAFAAALAMKVNGKAVKRREKKAAAPAAEAVVATSENEGAVETAAISDIF